MYQGDLTKNIFDDIKFDVITSFEVIEHINNPNEFMSIVNHKLQEKGLVYSVECRATSLPDTGTIDFDVSVRPEKVVEVTKILLNFLLLIFY